jgi:histidinol-phosphate aminotransferase
MPASSSRRDWLKNTATLLTGIGIAPGLLASEQSITGPQMPDGVILLNSNENAYGPSAATKKAMMEAVANSNRYPDEQVPVLRKEIADFWNVGKEHILMGGGSSEILGQTFLLVSSIKGDVITAEPSYKVWNNQTRSFGLQIKSLPLTDKRKLDLNAMLSAVDSNTRLMYICNPNNPTGTYVEDNALRNFVFECSKKCMVLVDEAYTEYSNIPSLKDIAVKNPNVVVAKTFSKIYGLAGARIGYAIAHEDTIKKLSNLQAWPNVSISMATAAAASAALKDQAFVKECREKTADARDLCYKTFRKLKLIYIPSVTSFVLFNIDKIGAGFSEKMEAKKIFVQYREHFGGKWCRVTMGTMEEMQTFCNALKAIASS